MRQEKIEIPKVVVVAAKPGQFLSTYRDIGSQEGVTDENNYTVVGEIVDQAQNRVFFVPKFVCKFGDKKYPTFKNQREFTMKFEK